MTYLTRCRRAALQRLRTVPPTVADRRLQNLKRLMQIGRSSSKYHTAKPDFVLRRIRRLGTIDRPGLDCGRKADPSGINEDEPASAWPTSRSPPSGLSLSNITKAVPAATSDSYSCRAV